MALTLYDFPGGAPSPRRARMVLAEKGIVYDSQTVDLANRAQMEDPYRSLNPRCTVPALQLEDGTMLCTVAGIVAFAEGLQPTPNLLGETAAEKGIVADWVSRLDSDGYDPVADLLRNSAERLKDRSVPGPDNYPQIPALAEQGRARLDRFFQRFDAHLADKTFVVLERFTYADIVGLVVVDFAKRAGVDRPPELSHLARWYAAVSARPCASA